MSRARQRARGRIWERAKVNGKASGCSDKKLSDKRTKECVNPINNDPIRQGHRAEQGFDRHDAVLVVLGDKSPSSWRHATVVLATLGDPSIVGSEI